MEPAGKSVQGLGESYSGHRLEQDSIGSCWKDQAFGFSDGALESFSGPEWLAAIPGQRSSSVKPLTEPLFVFPEGHWYELHSFLSLGPVPAAWGKTGIFLLQVIGRELWEAQCPNHPSMSKVFLEVWACGVFLVIILVCWPSCILTGVFCICVLRSIMFICMKYSGLTGRQAECLPPHCQFLHSKLPPMVVLCKEPETELWIITF